MRPYETPKDPRLGVWAASLALAIGVHALGWGLPYVIPDTPEVAETPASVLVEFTVPEPEPEPEEVAVAEPEPEPEPEVIIEPEPEPEVAEAEPEPEPEVAEPEPEPEPERIARAEPEPPTEVAPEPEVDVDPTLPPEPLTIGLQGGSFANGSSGPVFAAGDQARGGRPARRSRVREHADAPVEPVVEPEASDVEEAVAEAAPAREPRRRGRRGRSRDARLSSGVDRDISYPDVARREGVETDCVMRLSISAQGDVDDVLAIQCHEQGFGFEDAVREHVLRAFRFDPALDHGTAIATEVRWTHEFRIDT